MITEDCIVDLLILLIVAFLPRLFAVVFGICYIIFNIYLVIHVVASFGNQTVLNMPVSR